MANRIEAALARLAELHPKLIDLGLDRSLALLDRLGNPQDRLPPVIHLAGTNGKGSTAAFLAAMAQTAGLFCHSYSSPHLCRFHERIRLADQLISDQQLADLLDEVEQANAGQPITFFEITTAAAMLAFSRQPADLLILETGLGGKLDSTNVVARPLVCIITPIARDHEHFLGSDIAGIAVQKAGIMRRGVPVISAVQPAAAAAALQKEAEKTGAELILGGRDWQHQQLSNGCIRLQQDGQQYDLPAPSLIGPHQADNAALAALALIHSQLLADPATGFAGIARAKWPARVQDLTGGKLAAQLAGQPLWLDGAHNAHGAAALTASLVGKYRQKWTLIYGALNNRPAAEFLQQVKPLAEHVITLAIPDQPAAHSAEDLAAAARSAGLTAETAASPHAALQAARGRGPVLICGSLYLAGIILAENETLPD
jgi:dihydrofolate synthase/folylpolyglutamate synthase